MELKRVAITGLGAITPLGNNVPEYWDGLVNGVSGAAPITHFDASEFKTHFACEVKGFDPQDHFDRKEARKLDPFSQYALVVADEAFKDSGLDKLDIDPRRAGVIWGSGIGGLKTFQEECFNFVENGRVPRFNPFFIPKMIADIASGHISIRYNFRAANFTTVSACASSTNSLIDAFNYIRLGKADIFMAGGSEAAVNEAGVGGFNALKALSVRNDDPKTASRPFDKERDGFVLGEGGGALVVEELEHAKARGAPIYAELVGGGLSADASHMTAPHPEGLGAREVMEDALADSGIDPGTVDAINVHGTSTPLGDGVEVKAIKEVFGDKAYDLNISGTKSMTGHLLGAAGAIEAIASILSINHDMVPPTINHFNDDPELDSDLNYTFHEAQKREVKAAVSNTFGFGGHNSSVIFKEYSER
jgi:3-oxoacyl-[acyl-carrier-protein] synthase II